ncbi:hypothetical protein [Bacillus benzoevorans]|uniref:Uncharacterized protein n=1 Tax=Bacillus benzoevorans TaxID=1456 RepID=A0A7X0HTT3_9BACI|nr:hypothetical protein [Bacillus benzoevorans]MBB6446737.1 hypothetical protein [Bacillus benzoevorans]
MSETKVIIAENIKKYIDTKGIKHNWIIERIGISKPTFYKLLKGEGNINQFEEKILKLFRLKDPFYFHRTDIDLPKSLAELNRPENFMDYVALSYHGEENLEFNKGMEVFREFVELIDVLHSVSSPVNEVLERELS